MINIQRRYYYSTYVAKQEKNGGFQMAGIGAISGKEFLNDYIQVV